jgi:hypothetical protein
LLHYPNLLLHGKHFRASTIVCSYPRHRVLKRIEDIEDLPDEDKNYLFYVIDNLIKAVKLKSIA